MEAFSIERFLHFPPSLMRIVCIQLIRIASLRKPI